MIMGVSYALYEEKVMDQTTGTMLNTNLDNYRLAGLGDVGELVVKLMTGPGYDERGVIGIGEPPTVSPGAAISNAVANAIAVRVPYLPLTPERVLAALEGAQSEGDRASEPSHAPVLNRSSRQLDCSDRNGMTPKSSPAEAICWR